MKARITKRFLESIEPASGRSDVWVWDTALEGFGARILPSGAVSFCVQYRDNVGRTRRLALGRLGKGTTVEQARKRAHRELGRVSDGENPSATRQADRRRGTVKELADRYLEQHARPKKKPLSVAMDETNLRKHILPRLGRLRVDAVTREDVSSMHHAMRETPVAANRALSLLSRMMNLAELWGVRPDGSNPCRHVERYREKGRERYLSETELSRLGATLDEMETEAASPLEAETERQHERRQREVRSVTAAVRLLVFTACRRSEILGLRWEHVDLEARCLRLADSKTGAKTVPLNAPALALLEGLKATRMSDWVIPGRSKGTPLTYLGKAWLRIRERAKLEDVRLHDLRHSFASFGAGGGQSLLVIGRLLGHTQAATTSRYAHLADDPVRQATEAIGGRIAAAMERRPDADVVPLRGGRE